MAKEMGTVEIEEMQFTLFYDYDQLRDGKLTRLSKGGKIKWFELRTEMVFLEPLRKIFNRKSVAHKELNSSPESNWPRAAVMTAAFSILLNGVEALGSFLNCSKTFVHEHNRKRGKNYFAFREFIQRYMKDWDVLVQGTSYKFSYLPEILWEHFRNGITHAFVVGGGGIEYDADPTRWKIKWGGYLEIGPISFFEDFLKGVNNFFEDAKANHTMNFLQRFEAAYPC
jgi:hypothetical protein